MQPKSKSAGRKRETAEVLTSSPYKAKLVERQAMKIAAEEKKKAAKEKKTMAETNKKEAESKNKPKAGNSKSKVRKGKRRHPESDEESSDEEWPCLVCGELFCNSRSRETWVQCQICLLWAHDECTPGLPYFISPNCESETESE